MNNLEMQESLEAIAIVGMAGRFPRSKNLSEFWQNLADGVESVTFFSDEELMESGIDPSLLNNPNYVKASAVLEDIDLFDASFFDFNPREAEITDPQHRLFLECAWSALENAGYDPQRYQGKTGVYGGASLNNYYSFDRDGNSLVSTQSYQTLIGNDKDFLTTRVSYKLNLTGPSITVQTACSTSLVATVLACQSLLNYQCDLALAGGVSLRVPQKAGYLHEPGGTLSPDGHCRAFDAGAGGMIIGNGVGVVALKRLSEAIADGDYIHAVIKGAAINNDGAGKVGYTAPSVDGQAEVIAEAMMLGEVEPETISYIQAHGTGTALGDPIEIAALNKVFRASTDKTGFCALGSVKTNIGHLDAAAGIAGLIQTVLALKHKSIPPSLNFEQPNSEINFADSPFYVNTQLKAWETKGHPRRAGVSSLGIGGTNAHVVLEEAPSQQVSVNSGATPRRLQTQGNAHRKRLSDNRHQVLVISAKTESALETATDNLVEHLNNYSELDLADTAYTLQVGRKKFDYRRMVVGKDLKDVAIALQTREPERILTYCSQQNKYSIVFMFPGQGSQYANMGKELYETEPVFRKWVDRCSILLEPELGLDLRSLIYPHDEDIDTATEKLKQTQIAQPAIFVIEYALAQLWISWGIKSEAAIGHSIGEYVAATIAGVFSLEDVLPLVAVRGKLMQQMPSGSMLAVYSSEAKVKELLNDELSLAAINAPSLCVISGSDGAIKKAHKQLTDQEIKCRHLHTSHAFHSPMMDSILEVFTEEVKKVNLNFPKIPFISNLTGTWITTSEVTDPSYWTKHLRHTVHFAKGIAELVKDSGQILLEVGPSKTLNTFAKQQTKDSIILSSMRHPKDEQSDAAFLLNTLGRLWLAGVQVDWNGFHPQEQRQRIPLPTYPFERQRYWIEPQKKDISFNTSSRLLTRKQNIADWFYIPVWERDLTFENINETTQTAQKYCWLIFIDSCGLGSEIARQLEQQGQDFVTVTQGEKFTKQNQYSQEGFRKGAYVINPENKDDYDALLQELDVQGLIPHQIFHIWGTRLNSQQYSDNSSEQTRLGISYFENCQSLGFYSLLFLAQAIQKHNITTSIQIMVVTNNMQDVVGNETVYPEKATVLGACKVIPQEYPNITCRNIDVAIFQLGTKQVDKLVNQLITEAEVRPNSLVTAYRGGNRWLQTFKAIQLDETIKKKTRLRQEGVYLITGDLIDGLGLLFAEYLVESIQAKLILIGNSNLPEREEWQQWLANHNEQDSVSSEIRKIQALEKLGREFLIIRADLANEVQMLAAIDQAYEHFGVINGVFYVPEITVKSGVLVQDISQAECELQFQSKASELLVLNQVLQGKEIDFCLVQSSLSTILGGLSLVAYSAAYHFIDTFVDQQNQSSSFPWFTVNRQAFHSTSEKEITSTELAMSPQEVWESFELILSMGSTGQIVVSTGDLQARLDRSFRNKFVQKQDNHNQSVQVDSSKSHVRPSLQTAYIAPSNKIEQKITEICQDILGIEQIGINDSFFELGGHSLQAVQVTSRLRKTFEVELPLKTILFDAPTIAGIANFIAQKQRHQENEEIQETAALLEEIRNLSPEKIKQELATDSKQY